MRWYVCVKLRFPEPEEGVHIMRARQVAVMCGFFPVAGQFTDRESWRMNGTRPRPFGGMDPAPDEQPWDWAGPEE